jgi:hypothetical protein
MATGITKPLRGSVDSEGVIMGGATLTIDYELEASPYGLLQYESQRRSPKSLRTLEAKFQDQIRESDVKKFDGKLEATNSGKEHNLENFCKEVKKGIQYFGFQPFFYGPSQAHANKMINYAEDHHLVANTIRIQSIPSSPLCASRRLLAGNSDSSKNFRSQTQNP